MYFNLSLISYSVSHSSDNEAFHGLFEYLENNEIMKDKSHMWECVQAVTDKTFKLFLEVRADRVSDIFLSYVLARHCISRFFVSKYPCLSKIYNKLFKCSGKYDMCHSNWQHYSEQCSLICNSIFIQLYIYTCSCIYST